VHAPEGDVRVVYSPLDALALARKHPDRSVVFLAVGFETTAPTAAAAVREADRLGLGNFALLAAHRRAAPALASALEAPGSRVQAFLAAGHVATVTGLGDYEALAARYRVPIVVVGSGPVDLLEGILRAVRHLEDGTWGVENQYARAVRPEGNPQARASIEAVFEPADAFWRGLGRLPSSGLALRPQYRRFDADTRFNGARQVVARDPVGCSCGAVVTGRIKPFDCPSFGTGCTPDRPLGAPMVSAEGVCAAYHRYRRNNTDAQSLPAPMAILPTPATRRQA
jgi:hydrogenase expression/formation protein HypD